ncbi:hypothetical protein ACVWWK_001068 [Bradyrhizobium sp. LB9.1b]
MDILAGEVIGVFAHVERTDQHGAGGLHALDQRGIARGGHAVSVDLRACACGEARDVEQVLHREGHAGERADGLAGGDIGVDRARFGTGAIGGDVGERIEDGVVLLDARKRCFGRIERRHFAARNRARDIGSCHLWLCRHGGVRP